MNIYLFTRNKNYPIDWDEYVGFVVSARDEKEARKLINDFDEFNRPEKICFDCKLVGYKIDSKSEILLDSFNAG